MRHLAKCTVIALGLWASAALGEGMTVAGHDVHVAEDRSGSSFLMVGGSVLHEDGLILLDPEPVVLGGLTVVTGVAGAGGNACNASPFVVALPEGGAPEFWGPVNSCAYFTLRVEGDRLVFASDALPGTPGETWVWTPGEGFVPGPATPFVADAGWEALDTLAGAHPADALRLTPVIEALQVGLGPDFPAYADLIGGLGAGDLTDTGYLGSACDKFTCETDWAILYLNRDTRGVFAVWRQSDGGGVRHWPEDRSLWPKDALFLLTEAERQ